MKVCVCPREAKQLAKYERLLIVTSPRVGMQGMRANCGKRQRLELNERTYLLPWRGRGVLLRILGGEGVCRPVLQILTRFIRPKNVIFHTRFQTNKTLRPIPVFRPVVQTLDSAIQRINHYPTDKY